MLPPQTHMGAIALTVSDLSRSLAYYEQMIGLRQLRREGNTAVLGAGTAELLTLHEQKGAQPAPRHTGLFHFALLLPTRRDLALVLRHLAQNGADWGASDHGVSEALYLNDPDGHGIEIYRDRPRAEWQMPNGELAMVTMRLNAPSILAEIGAHDMWQGLPEGTVMGHIHLQVADMPTAEQFYTQVIGFDPMQRYGRQASFVSAGGYHHHLGFNTWNSAGATSPPAGSAVLNHYTIVLPNTAARDAVVERLTAAHIPTHTHTHTHGIFFQDPFQIGVVLAVGS